MLNKEIASPVLTIEEFRQLPDDGKKYELMEGRLLVMSPAKATHTLISNQLNKLLDRYANPLKLGESLHEISFFIFHPETNTVYTPDVAFVRTERFTTYKFNDYLPFPPDLAVEIVSEENRHKGKKDFERKIRNYQRAGVSLIWVIDPEEKVAKAKVYRPANIAPSIVTIDDELDGEAVLPGFRLSMRELLAPYL